MKIAIVTDSACNITPEIAEDQGIYVLPLQVIFEEEVYREGVDLTTQEFYEKIVESDKIPTTSQPSAADTVNLLKKLVQEYNHILCIHMDARLSGTFQTTRAIANEINAEKITVVDSGLVTIPAREVILEAKRIANEGANVEEIIAHIEDVRQNTIAFTALNDLDYLLSGGRIAKLAGALVKKIKIKPVIRVHAEKLNFVGSARTEKRAVRKLLDESMRYVKDSDFAPKLVIGYGNNPEDAKKLRASVKERCPEHDIDLIRINSVIGVHTGPEVLGIGITKDYSKI